MAMAYHLGVQRDNLGKIFMLLVVYVDYIINIIC